MLCLALVGCASMDRSWINFVDGLNRAKIKSCLDTHVAFAGGAGIGAGITGSIVATGLTVSGGMTPKACAEYRKMLRDTGGTI